MKKVICFLLFSLLFFLLDERAYASIVLSEFFPNPEGSDEQGEWIEVYNDGDNEVSLEGYTLSDVFGATSSYTFKQSDDSFPKIPGKSYLVFPKSTTHITLNNDIEQIMLKSPIGVLEYSEIFSPVEEGFSLSYINSTWRVSTPTPGLINVEKTVPESTTHMDPTPTPAPTQNIAEVMIPSPTPTVLPTPTGMLKTTKPIIQNIPKKSTQFVSENTSMKVSTSASEVKNDVMPILLTNETEEDINITNNDLCTPLANNGQQTFIIVFGIFFQLLSCFILFLEWYNKRHEKRDNDSDDAIHAGSDMDDSHIPSFISK